MLSLCYMLYRKQLQSLWYNIKFYLLIQFIDQTEVYQNTNCIFLITSTHHGRRRMTYNIQEFCSSVRPLCHSVTPPKPVNIFQRIFWGLISYSPLLFFFIQMIFGVSLIKQWICYFHYMRGLKVALNIIKQTYMRGQASTICDTFETSEWI